MHGQDAYATAVTNVETRNINGKDANVLSAEQFVTTPTTTALHIGARFVTSLGSSRQRIMHKL
jgi:hypothetical protein